MFKNRGNSHSGNRSFSKPSFGTDRPDMHRATCSSCGKTCEVPFKPTGSKPVFCRDCFKKTDSTGPRSFGNKSYGPSADRELFDAICASCGNKCKIPFRASPGREVFCSRCFEKQESGSDRKSFDRPTFNPGSAQPVMQPQINYKADFEALNSKIDKILQLLTPTAPLESLIKELEQEKIEIEPVPSPEVANTIKKPRAKTKKSITKKS